MCGRFLITSTPEDVQGLFDVRVTDNFPPRWNVAPTQPIPVIRQNAIRAREYALVRWGFAPSWAKKEYYERMGSKPLINARGETVAKKPTFRSAYKHRRCLVPADGFYEWRSEKGARQPYLIKPETGGLFAFAGIWETAIDPDGGEIDTAAIITVAANADLAPLHSREPVVIARSDYQLWLEGDERDQKEIAPLVTARPEGFWNYYPVSKAVNNVRNDGPELARAFGQQELFG